jgi:UDP-glucose 4-epimerase
MTKVLITGANSYIGNSVRDYLLQYTDKYSVDIKDTIGWDPKPEDFTDYEVVFNVAGIAHVKETPDNRHLYYEINRDLAIRIAEESKRAGVKQYILLSTMSVYGKVIGYITKDEAVSPRNAYGISKAEADRAVERLASDDFKFACLRPPMVYGRGCKGNYQSLRKLALKTPIFSDYKNQRSMIYIGNLCEFVKARIDEQREGVFFPQNSEYVCTTDMVRRIAEANGKKIKTTKAFNWMFRIIPVNLIKKVFGNLTYEKVDLVDKYGFDESIKLTEE